MEMTKTAKVFVGVVLAAILVFLTAFITSKYVKSGETEEATVQVEDLTQPAANVQTYDLEKVLTLDAEYMAMNYGDDYVFYCSNIVMNNYIDADGDIQPVVITNVYQVGDVCVQINHDINGNTKYLIVHDYWMQCQAINIPVAMNFNKAIDAFRKSNIVKPHTNVLVLRHPLNPKIKNPWYIAGTNKTGYIRVDVETGEVLPVK